MTPEQERHLKALLFNEEGELDRVLKLAAFYILAAEELRNSIEEKARFFFDIDGEQSVTPVELPEEFLGLRSPKQAVRLSAAVNWFLSLGAFDETDKELVRHAIDIRNLVAHEFSALIWKLNSDNFDEAIAFGMIVLTNKINKWWLKNFEAAIDPDFLQVDGEVDFDSAEDLSAQFTRVLFLTAFPSFAEQMKSKIESSGDGEPI